MVIILGSIPKIMLEKPIIQSFENYRSFLETLRLSRQSSDLGIFVLDIRDIPEEAVEAFQMYRNDFYEINLIDHQYDCQFTIDGVRYHPQGSAYLCFVAPNQLQSYQVSGEDTQAEGFIIYILKSAFHQLSLSGKNLPFFKTNFESYYEPEADQFAELIFWVRRMHQEFNTEQPFKEAILKAQLEIFLLKCLAYFGKVKSVVASRPQQIVHTFLELIQEKKTAQKTVYYYAQELALSPKHLNQLTQQVLGKNALRLIQEAIVEEAKTWLSQSPERISTIAYHLGFEEPAHFSRLFKRIAGCSPAAYRRAVQF